MTSQAKKSPKSKTAEEQQITFDPVDTDPDQLLPQLIHKKHIIGISTVLEAYHDKIKDSTLLSTCIYLARNSGFESTVNKYLPQLEDKYPAQVASIKAYILVNNCSANMRQEKCAEALEILDNVRRNDKKNMMLIYNMAYIYALQHNKEMALKYLQSTLTSSKKKVPYASTILLLIRILRSNCQTAEALNLATLSYDLLNRYDKNISIEGMFAAAEKGDMTQMEFFFQKLRKYFKNDITAMESLTKLNLMLGKTQNAADNFQAWSEFDQESPEFFFCCSQLCLAAQDTAEAIHYLMYAIQLDPNNADYLANIATILYKTGSKEKAYDRARSAVRANPDSVHAWLAVATVSPDDGEAREALNKAMELRKTVVDLSGLNIILNE